MFSAAAARDLIGRRVIIGVSQRAHDGRLMRQDQYQGRIVRADRMEGVVIQMPSAELLTLPADLRAFLGARRGHYTFRGSGHVLTDPDLETNWTHTLPPPDGAQG